MYICTTNISSTYFSTEDSHNRTLPENRDKTQLKVSKPLQLLKRVEKKNIFDERTQNLSFVS